MASLASTPANQFMHMILTCLAEETEAPYFAFSWLNDNNTFQAEGASTMKIKIPGEAEYCGVKEMLIVLT